MMVCIAHAAMSNYVVNLIHQRLDKRGTCYCILVCIHFEMESDVVHLGVKVKEQQGDYRLCCNISDSNWFGALILLRFLLISICSNCSKMYDVQFFFR